VGLFSIFKKQITNIFISDNENKKLDTGSGCVDYVLSRSLYSSIPTQDASYSQYSLGNYSIKTYIDTLSSHISTPIISTKDAEFTPYVNSFIARNKSTFLNIAKQSMIDGVSYVWLRLEKSKDKPSLPQLRLLPRENVLYMQKNKDGSIQELVLQWEEQWKTFHLPENDFDNEAEEKVEKAIIRVTLKAYSETWQVIGDALPPGYSVRKEEWKHPLAYVPIFPVYNNKLAFLDDGIPEVAPLLPFIRKYNSIFEQIDAHLNRILSPKLKLKLKSASSFLKNSLGIREGDYKAIEKGEYKPDVTQFKVAILSDKDEDASYIFQENNIQSAIAVLNLIHWIIVELTMPEYLYGTALNTTNASVREQSPVWVKKIEDRRCEFSAFYYWILQTLHTYSLAINGRDVYKDFSIETSSVDWEELQAKDDVAMMSALKTFTDAINSLLENAIISPESAFNALKNYLTIPNEWNEEHDKAIAHIKEMMELEAKAF